MKEKITLESLESDLVHMAPNNVPAPLDKLADVEGLLRAIV